MPIHDWTLVEAGTFHAFHFFWIATLCDRLNKTHLPPGYFAIPDQRVPGPELDILMPPPKRIVESAVAEQYAKKADRIAVHHGLGNIVGVIEIVSPGNKGSRHALRSFVDKAAHLIQEGVHLLVIDLFPPSVRDPRGIHKAIWDEIDDELFEMPMDKPLTLASYSAGPEKKAYVEPIAVGDEMPDMPLFLDSDHYVPIPLEASYQATWAVLPAAIKELFE